MADNHTPEVRSYIMSQIRSKDTKPELIVRSYLHCSGFRFRLHRKDLPGRPDIVLPRYRVLIMVHGCFWHAHQDPKCNVFKWPTSRQDWWRTKLTRNRERDESRQHELQELGWKVIVIWECQLNPKRLRTTLERTRRAIVRHTNL